MKLGSLFICAALLGSACSDINEEHLRLNTKEEHYSIAKSREDGERDLVMLANTETIEDALYFADQKDDIDIWYEAGEEEMHGEVKFSHAVLDYIVWKGGLDRIAAWHYHPLNDEEYDVSQTFSACDIKGAVNLMEHINETDPELIWRYDFGIAVSTGIYLVQLNPEILHDRHKMDKVRAAQFNISVDRCAIRRGISGEFDYSLNNFMHFPELNKYFAEKHSNDSVIIWFYEIE